MSIRIAKELNVGDTFYESGYGEVLSLTVTSKPERSEEGQWTWTAETADGNNVNYLITEGYEHYGPSISLD